GEHTFVAPASVIMKGEALPSWTSWDGNPARLSDEAVVLSDSFVEESSELGSLSPLTKGKNLPSWTSREEKTVGLSTLNSMRTQSIDFGVNVEDE
ncbi:MAG TPA: hypothetical protein VN278_00020, partial [Methanosarcina sp.]|nr:hypothetical protein [Methanosarcina sp.]